MIAGAMLLDRVMPAFDATRAEHRVIDGVLPSVYDAVLRADMVETWRANPAVRVLFGARTLAERGVALARGRPPQEPAEPASLRIGDLRDEGEWVRLAEDPPAEIVFGAVGRFWGGETAWRTIAAAEFDGFAEPGYARIACNFSLRPYGEARTLVSYECRTQATDAAAREAFLRYWRAVRIGVGIVLRAQLATVERERRRAG